MSDLINFLGGLLQGFNQDQQFRQQQAALDDYKKQMAKKVQMEIDELAKRDEAINKIEMGNGTSVDYIRAGIKPQDRLIMDLLEGGRQQPAPETTPGIPQIPQGVFQEENPLGIPQEMRQKVTFPGELTGVPRSPLGAISKEAIAENMLIGKPITGIRAYQDTAVENGREITTQRDARGGVVGSPTSRPLKGTWQKTQVPGVMQFFDEYGGATSNIRMGEQEYEVKTKENPDGSTSPIWIPKQPGVTPQQGPGAKPSLSGPLPKPGQPIVFDNQATIDEFFGSKGKTQSPSSSGSGIQLTPPTNKKIIPAAEWGEWYNPIQGKTLDFDADIGTAKKAGFEKVPKISAEQAGKFAAGAMAIDEHLPFVEKALFPKSGFNQTLYRQMVAYTKSPELAGGTEGAAYAKRLEETAEAWLRIKTGAAQTDPEMKQSARTYVGQWLSTPKTIKSSFQMLRGNIEAYLKAQDPKGVMRAMTTRQEKMIGDKKAVRINGVWGYID